MDGFLKSIVIRKSFKSDSSFCLCYTIHQNKIKNNIITILRCIVLHVYYKLYFIL